MRRLVLIAIGALAVALAIGANALAYITAGGTGSASATVGSLDAPAAPTATPGGVGVVDIGWHRSTLSDGTTPAQRYYVARYSGATLDGYACGTNPTGTNIPDSAADGSGDFACSDTGLTSSGPYTYKVVAVWHSWTATSSASNSATVALSGPIDHFALSAASTSVTAGAADTLTITAKDSANRTVVTYTGSHNLTFSGPDSIGGNDPTVTNSSGTAIAFGSNTATDFSGGVASATMKLYKAETASVVVSDGSGHDNGSGLSITVSADVANKLAFVQQPTDTTAGQTITPSVTVAINDQYGNRTSSTANVTVAGTTLSGTTTRAAVAGLATFDDLSMTSAGSRTLTASSSGLAGATSSSFNITAASANKLVFTTQPSNSTGGSAISPAPAVTVQDAYGNTVTSSSASVTVAIGTNPSSGTLSGTKTVSASSGVASFSGLSIDKAGTGYTLTASSSGLTGATSSSFNVTVGPAAQLAFTQQPSNGQATVALPTQPKVTVQDAGGNTVTTDTGSVTLAIGTNPGGGSLSCTSNPVNAVAGVATFSGCKISAGGTGYTLTASRTGLTPATSNPFNIAALTPTSLSIANGTGTLHKADTGDVITVTFNQAIQLSSVCSSWSLASQTVDTVTVTMNKGNGSNHNDLSVSGGKVGATSCVGGITIGSFTTTTQAFDGTNTNHSFTGSTVAWNSATNALVITLGTGSAPNTVSSATTYTYNPDPAISAAADNTLKATGSTSVTAINF